jgi:hypothetical protein
MTFRRTLSTAIAVAAICCFTLSGNLAAATVPEAAPIITYIASGTFSSPAVSGADKLLLAGEPFQVQIKVSAATKPYQTHPGFAAYNKLRLTGEVHSGLVGSTPVPIASSEATIIQAINPNVADMFTMESPLKVSGISVTITATITMPYGTIATALLHPFSPIALTPSNTAVKYSDGTNTTYLTIESGGTLTATIP